MFRPYKAIFRQLLINYNCRTAPVSIDEQLAEDGLVRPKHVAIKCDFDDILK
jgi:hypothetical protein